ncbi:MAG: DUF3467 domain-containing protein [Candidatus Kerfeldbacteria bacterium]|nr:DUF3467 domain-containing protein [Candidatus Kerfeldbacteria bacterium]
MAQPAPQPINIKADDATLKGVYANTMFVSHTPEEFVMDFMNVMPQPPQGMLVGRVITSPGHFKRIIAALTENLKRYEKNFGTVEASSEPTGQEIGFKPSA